MWSNGWTDWEHFDAGLSRGNSLDFKGGGSIFHQKSGECHDLQRKQIKINFLKIKCTIIDIIKLQLSRTKPGNPASIDIIVLVDCYMAMHVKQWKIDEDEDRL